MNDTWEDGELFRSLQKKHIRLRQEREEIDKERKLSASRKRKLTVADTGFGFRIFQFCSAVFHWIFITDLVAEEEEKDEVLRLRAAILKRDLTKLQAEELDLEFRRKNHIRFSRLIEVCLIGTLPDSLALIEISRKRNVPDLVIILF